MRALLWFAALLLAGAAHAAPGTTAGAPSVVADGADLLRVLLDKPFSPKEYTPAEGGVDVGQKATATLPSGKQVQLDVKRRVAAETARASMKAIAKNLIPGVGLAVDLWEIMRDQGVEQGPDGKPVIDPGQAKETVGGVMQDFRTGQPMTPGAIAGRESSMYCTSQSGCSSDGTSCYTCAVTSSTGSCTNGSCSYSWSARVSLNGSTQWHGGGNNTGPEITTEQCPEAGSALPVRGGLPCPTNNRVPATPDHIDDAVDDIPAPRLPDMVKGLDGIMPGIPTVSNIPSVTGPGTVEDGQEVKTKPDGSIVTTRREWRLQYPGDGTVKVTPRLVETGPGGTTTTDGGLPAAAGTDTRTDCDKYPDSIGCSKYGELDGPPLNKESKNVDFDPVQLAGGAGCPANPTFNVFSRQVEIPMATICSTITDYVKPVVLVIGAAAAAFIFVGGLKS